MQVPLKLNTKARCDINNFVSTDNKGSGGNWLYLNSITFRLKNIAASIESSQRSRNLFSCIQDRLSEFTGSVQTVQMCANLSLYLLLVTAVGMLLVHNHSSTCRESWVSEIFSEMFKVVFQGIIRF